MSLAPGSRLGPYEVSTPLGAGGMGEVWRARDSRLQRDVAIKTLPPAFADDTNRLARFQREAQVLAQLSHPNIAAIYGLEEVEGSSALVMELVEGQTLAERIAAGPIPPDEAVAIARQIGAALEAAHDKGVVHRDLKPANVKLTPDGKVKVLDFGLAKAFDPETISGDPAASPTLTLDSTRAGMILGTAGYMSPEQARGKPVDKRADIWAFGVVLYEMLTGRMLFEGETVSDTLAAVLRSDIDFKALPANTPAGVRRLLERCLERDPKRRLRDMGDAWYEIDSPAAVSTAAPTTAPAKRTAVRYLPWAAGIIVALAGIAWGLLHTPTTPPQPVLRWSMVPSTPALGMSLSRDGSLLTYMNFTTGSPTIDLRELNQLEAKTVPGTDAGFFPVFSPDNQWIAYLNGNGATDFRLKKIPVTGGTSITLAEHAAPFGLSWGDDDTLVFYGAKGLQRIPSAGGTAETLTTVDNANDMSHRWPSHMPGSRTVLFNIRSGTTNQLAAVDVKTHRVTKFSANGTNPHYAAGYLIFFRSGTLFAAPFNERRLEIAGPEVPMVENIAVINGVDSGDYSIADSGLLVNLHGAGLGGKTVLHWSDRKGVTQALSDAQQWGTGRLSPDGKKIANSIHVSNTSGDVWVYDLDRRTPTRLTFGGLNQNPIWTRDGRWITYSGTNDDKHGIYRVAADASGKPELLTATDSEPTPSSWSPDGKTLVYTAFASDKHNRLWAMSWPGGKPHQLHEGVPFGEVDGEVSPDGRWIAYQSSEAGLDEIYVQPFPGPGSKTRISTQGGNSPRWSHNGKELFYWGGAPRGLMAVEVQEGPNFHAGIPEMLFHMSAGTTWDVAPDGKRFLVEISESTTSGRRLDAVVNWFDELRRRAPARR